VRRRRARGSAWPPVQQVGCRLERQGPERQGSCTVNEHGAHAIVKRPKDMLGLPICCDVYGHDRRRTEP
jgi:hypothetical protein